MSITRHLLRGLRHNARHSSTVIDSRAVVKRNLDKVTAMPLTVTRSRRKRTALRRQSAPTRAAITERYSAARKAEFLLNNAATLAEYRAARQEVKALGINPDSIPHQPPNSR